MTELATTFNPEPTSGTDASPEPTVVNAALAPTLITEQEVLFGSSAAVALPPATTRRFTGVVESVRSAFARREKRPARKHYPRRHAFIENAAMARAMDRL